MPHRSVGGKHYKPNTRHSNTKIRFKLPSNKQILVENNNSISFRKQRMYYYRLLDDHFDNEDDCERPVGHIEDLPQYRTLLQVTVLYSLQAITPVKSVRPKL